MEFTLSLGLPPLDANHIIPWIYTASDNAKSMHYGPVSGLHELVLCHGWSLVGFLHSLWTLVEVIILFRFFI